MRKEIVLIGPVGVGKTTVSKILAEKLGLPRVSMDDYLFAYMSEVGFEEDHWKKIVEKQGKPGGYRYLRVFGAHAVERLLSDHRACIFDFGGGGVMGEFPDEFARIQAALSEFANVVLLLPTPEKRESLDFLYERWKIQPKGWTILEHIIYHPSHESLAKHTVYVKGKSPDAIADEILRIPLAMTPN